MSGLRRPTPAKQVQELAQRLAEDYDSIPLPEIARVVQNAADTVHANDAEWAGSATGIPAILDIVEQLAREDLDAARTT